MKEVSDEHFGPIALSKMKRMIAVLSLVLCMSMSLSVSAGAASYVPDDITYQNLNGQQLAVKAFTLLPDQDPSDLIEADFEHDGYLYSYSDIVKEDQMFNEENIHKEVVTVTTATKNLEDILEALQPTIEYEMGDAKGTLALDHSTIKTEAAGYKSSSYTVTATKNYTGLARNDSSLIEKAIVKDGRTLSLSNVTWSVESWFPQLTPPLQPTPVPRNPLWLPVTSLLLNTLARSSLPASRVSSTP